MKQESEERLKTQKAIIEHLWDALAVIAQEGNLQDKLMGVAISSIIYSTKQENEDAGNGICEYIEKTMNHSLANGSIKPGYIEHPLLCLENMGLANVQGLINDFKIEQKSSIHEYDRIDNNHANGYEESQQDKMDFMKSVVDDLNVKFSEGEINSDEMEEELKKAILKANKEFLDADKMNIIHKVISDTPNIRNKIVSDLFTIYTHYKSYVDKHLENSENDTEARDNKAALTMIKTIMIAHKINMTKELYSVFWDNKKEMGRLVDLVNELMAANKQDCNEFFLLEHIDKEEQKRLENKILSDPEFDANMKKQIEDLFNNPNNLN